MKALLWVVGVIVASVIGYFVWKALQKVDTTKYDNQKVLDNAINTGPVSTGLGKVLKPNFMIETGMGGKKGFIR